MPPAAAPLPSTAGSACPAFTGSSRTMKASLFVLSAMLLTRINGSEIDLDNLGDLLDEGEFGDLEDLLNNEELAEQLAEFGD